MSAICIQETWLIDNSDTSLLHLLGFNLISVGKVCNAQGGLLIYLNNDHKHKILTCTTNLIFGKDNLLTYQALA